MKWRRVLSMVVLFAFAAVIYDCVLVFEGQEGSWKGTRWNESADRTDGDSDTAPAQPGADEKSVPLLLQTDYRETVCTIGGKAKSVSTSGCGAVCVAMAASVLTGSAETPATLFQWAYDSGLYFGDGLGHDALSQLAARCGMRGEWIGNDEEEILDALAANRLVIAHMGRGTFTQNGHYILLYGIDEEGLIRVNDPYSAERSEKTYPLALIIKEAKLSSAFMVLEPEKDEAVRIF